VVRPLAWRIADVRMLSNTRPPPAVLWTVRQNTYNFGALILLIVLVARRFALPNLFGVSTEDRCRIVLSIVSCRELLKRTPALRRPHASTRTLREQAAVQQEWLRYRLDSVLPRLMRQYQSHVGRADARVQRDPCSGRWSPPLLSMHDAAPSTSSSTGPTRGRASRAGGAHRAVIRGLSREEYRSVDRPPPELVDRRSGPVRRVIEERDPQTIAVDISHTHAFSDGLSAASGAASRRAL